MSLRRPLTGAVLGACLALLPGCWDQRPIEQLGFVTMAAFDGRPGHIHAWAQVTLPTSLPGSSGSSSSSGKTFATLEGSGADEAAALNNIELADSKTLWFGQFEVLLVSDRLARAGATAGALDYFMRAAKTRTIGWVFIAPHRRIPELMSLMPTDATYPAEALVSRGLAQHVLSQADVTRTYEVFSQIHNLGRDAVVPVVDTDGKNFTLGTSALFRQRRLVGELDVAQSRQMAVLRNLGGQELSATVPCGPTGTLSAQLGTPHTRIGVKIHDGQLAAFTVDFQSEARVGQVSGCPMHLNSKAGLQTVSDMLGRDSVAEMETTLSATRALGSDPFGFGEALRIADGRLWQSLAPDWPHVVARTPILVTSHVTTRSTGMLSYGEPPPM